MGGRQLLCACEDVTVKDVRAAIAGGNRDMESVKRFTGAATGICQGRSCMAGLARCLLEAGCAEERLRPTTPRPPLLPTSLATFAGDGPLMPVFPGPQAPALTPALPSPPPPPPQTTLPARAHIVIVGGGIVGLSTAYHLAKEGVTDVVVLERGYLNVGASGRNGGGIRCQWSTEGNILLMQESLRLCRQFAHELGINTWLRQGGYLFLTSSPAGVANLERNIALQNRLGVPTRLLSAAKARRVVPELWVDDVLAAAFNPEDGVFFPWPFLWGYAERARALGVRVETFTPVTGLDTQHGRLSAVETPRGRIECDLVINASAAWCNEVAGLAGVRLPNRPQRHEILVTESLRPFLGPLVSELHSGLYFSQSLRGELVVGLGDPEQPDGIEMRSSARFLQRTARALTRRMPVLADVQVVRQWAGCYDVTPDGNPVIGEVSEMPGFFQLHGFVGHGFMMAPAVGRRVARLLARGHADAWLSQNNPQRFAAGAKLAPETMIIG